MGLSVELDPSAVLDEDSSCPRAQERHTWAELTSLSSLWLHLGLEQMCSLSDSVFFVIFQQLLQNETTTMNFVFLINGDPIRQDSIFYKLSSETDLSFLVGSVHDVS